MREGRRGFLLARSDLEANGLALVSHDVASPRVRVDLSKVPVRRAHLVGVAAMGGRDVLISDQCSRAAVARRVATGSGRGVAPTCGSTSSKISR